VVPLVCPVRGPSAANPVAQVQHPVAPDHHVGVLQQVLAAHRPEIPLTGPEHHRHEAVAAGHTVQDGLQTPKGHAAGSRCRVALSPR